MKLIRQSLEYYRDNKYRTGGFLEAMLANDLESAVGRADFINSHRISDIMAVIIEMIPSRMRGSYEKVEKHLKKDDMD